MHYSYTLNYCRWPTVGDKHLEEFQNKENFLNYLNHHRYTLDTSKPTVTEELDFYSNLMREFMQWFYDAIMEARSGTVWKDLVSLQEIVEAREAFGIERALGTIFFTTGSFGNMDDYLRYVQSQDIANVTLNSAREYSPLVDKIYNSTIADIDRYGIWKVLLLFFLSVYYALSDNTNGNPMSSLFSKLLSLQIFSYITS